MKDINYEEGIRKKVIQPKLSKRSAKTTKDFRSFKKNTE